MVAGQDTQARKVQDLIQAVAAAAIIVAAAAIVAVGAATAAVLQEEAPVAVPVAVQAVAADQVTEDNEV